MDPLRIKVNEDQLDALAGRVADLEYQIASLIKLLGRGSVGQKLGVDEKYFSLVTTPGAAGLTARLKHSNERANAIHEAERDQFISRIKRAEAFASLSHRSFPEAWEAISQETAVQPQVDHHLVAGFKKKGRGGRLPVRRSKRKPSP